MENKYKEIAHTLILETFNFTHSLDTVEAFQKVIKQHAEKQGFDCDALIKAAPWLLTNLSLNILDPVFRLNPEVIKEAIIKHTSGKQQKIALELFEKDLDRIINHK